MSNPGKRRNKTLGVPVSESEEELIAIGAALGAEDVAGYMRRLAVMNARRRIVANGGIPPAPVVERKGGA